MTRRAAIAAAAVAALIAAGCGGGTTTVIQTTTTQTVGTDAPASDTTTGDINQELIDQFAKTSGGENLANICKQLAKGYPRTAAYKQAENALGPIITKQGGDISVVINGLLDRC